ncbi:MAG: DUF3810 domain-containing protein, partial [Flavobacteriaceae bacterium]
SLCILAGRYLYKRWKTIGQKPLVFLKNIAVVLSITYFMFHFLWGMNYYRKPITEKLGIEKEYTIHELKIFTKYLIEKSNHYQTKITGDSITSVKIPYSKKEIFQKTKLGYESLKEIYPDFEYKSPSLKSSLFSLPLTYMGYGGYINPFSNEAQVNGLTPPFRLPTVSGHEVGHQLGYSAEDDTNFIGFLVSSKNEDNYFKYAAYSNSLAYCLSDLSKKDSTSFKESIQQINPGVRKNFKEVSKFWEQYENPLEPVFKSIFNTFLKANNQEEGIKSYNSVVGLLISYHSKNGF